jgi:tetratricopeptide (TPR) repeat protein
MKTTKSPDRCPNEKVGNYIGLCLLLIVITLLVYGQVRQFDFIIYDDPLFVTTNINIQKGFTWDSILWAFTNRVSGNWHPLTWLSFMLDYQLYGLSPGGYHLTNLFWHLLNVLLLFGILRAMTREIWPSFFVAVLFAIHPLRVESVVWITERKDVLSSFFWLLAIWFYLRYSRAPVLKNYIPVIINMGLGLMAKPMPVTLPFTLLLLDFWPLQRGHSWRSWIPLLREKIPLIILALALVVFHMWGSVSVDMRLLWDPKPLPLRIENAVISYVTYLYKFFCPVGLSIYYPYPDSGFHLWQPAAALIILAGLSWLAWCSRRRFPYALVGWLWFIGTLVPVIGVVQVVGHAMADRYTYVPLIGIFIILAWGIKDVMSWRPSYRRVLIAVCVGMVITYAVLCYMQAGHWKNSVTLFQHDLSVREDNSLVHACLGAAFLQQGDPNQAEMHLVRALEIKPNLPEAFNDLGTISIRKGMYEEAVERFSQAIALNSDYAEAHNNLAMALAGLNRFDEAVKHYEKAISLNPMSANALNNLGTVLAQQGRFEDAKPYFLKALAIQPNYEEAYNNLGLLYYQQRDYENSGKYFEEGLNRNSNNPRAYYFLGLIAAEQGRTREAADCFSQALRLDPGFQEAAESLRRVSGMNQPN